MLAADSSLTSTSSESAAERLLAARRGARDEHERPPLARTPAAGRSPARTGRQASVGWHGINTAVAGLLIWVMAGWLLVAGAVAMTLPASAAARPMAGFVAVPGQTARIQQSGLPDWPIPVDRRAYDAYYRGFAESDDEAIERAFAASDWITVVDRQTVKIVEVDGEAVHVELLEGPNAGRHGWLKTRHLGP
jgi:hypothetical protein